MAPTQQAAAPGGENNVPFFNIHGRNGYDDPFVLRSDEVCEALNGDFYGAGLMRRRGGATTLSLAGGTAPASGARFLCRHVPGSDQSAAEMWMVDGTGRVKRLAGGTAWVDVSLDDAITGNYGEVNAVSFNGKLYFCYQSGQNRLHVWDPTLSLIRRVGIATFAAAPTVANTGAGTYAATKRYYKAASVVQVAGVTTRRSELSASVSFTPSGGGTAARVTRPTAVGEHETHWELWGSSDDTNYFILAVVVIATTTFDDSVAPANYATTTPSGSGVAGTVPPIAGSYLPPPAAKYIVADATRMIMGGCWETTGGYVPPSNSQIWWTSNLGSSNISDDERVSINTSITARDDVGESVTGISAPQQGSFYLYSYTHQWKYVATPSVTSPYQRFIVSGGQGCISHKTIIVAHDDSGYPATYWDSQRGQERAGRYGNQYCGIDISDLWYGTNALGQQVGTSVNLDATTLPFSVYHQDIHQIWTWLPTGTSNTPDLKVVFDTWLGKVVDVLREGAVRGGWSRHTGESAKAYCATMFSDSVAASMGRRLKPYIGYVTTTQVWKCDTTNQDDSGNPFQAYIESKPLSPWGLGRKGGLTEEAMLIAAADPGVDIQLSIIVDEGADVLTSKLSMSTTSKTAAETRVFPQFDSSRVGNASSIRLRVGDASAVTVAPWLLTAVIIPLQDEGER